MVCTQDREVVLFVGDGSFQVTAQDLSTYIRNNLKPVVFLINNDGYTIERFVLTPDDCGTCSPACCRSHRPVP
jgi:TPP-dependent 2-oxoacid decarboxylase